MRYLLIYLYLTGVLFTTGVLVECNHEDDAPAHKMKFGLAMLLLAVVAWPIMLGLAVGEYMKETHRFR